ncbi:MAG: GTPase Era [Rhizobiaceae bacterium]
MNTPSHTETKAGFVALIGAPNAGKSTLMNQLVGTKVSIVTHKVQTTRAIIRGIATRDNVQAIFVDTPGIFRPRRRLDEAMVTTAWGGARDADLVLMLVDATRGLTEDVRDILTALSAVPHRKALVINKVDAVRRDTLLEIAAQANALCGFEQTFMISALKGDGCGTLNDWIDANLPPSPFLYPDDDVSDLPMRQLAAEITREKLFVRLHDELPYASHVETEAWTENPDGSVKIQQVIYVERDSQKKIVIGKSGATIKAISMAARRELSEILEQTVHLFLFVKVRENWSDDPARYREMGLDFPRR